MLFRGHRLLDRIGFQRLVHPKQLEPFGVPGAGDTINVTNGTINLSAPVTISGVFNWFGGSLSGNAMTLTSAGVMNIVSNFGYLNNLLTNAGTVTMTGSGTLYVENNNTATYHGGVYNLPGALWDLQTNTSIYSAGYGAEFFNNAGNFRKSVSSSAAAVGLTFINTGTVSNLLGALSFSGGGTLAGSYNIAPGATIYFGGRHFQHGPSPRHQRLRPLRIHRGDADPHGGCPLQPGAGSRQSGFGACLSE